MNILMKVHSLKRGPLVKALKDDGHEVFPVTTFIEASDCYRQNQINCLMVDLDCFATEFVEEELIKETQGGSFSGYVWLKHYIYQDDQEREKTKKKTIILCSGHYSLEKFRRRFSAKELEGIIVLDVLKDCVAKGGFIETIKQVIAKIKKAA